MQQAKQKAKQKAKQQQQQQTQQQKQQQQNLKQRRPAGKGSNMASKKNGSVTRSKKNISGKIVSKNMLFAKSLREIEALRFRQRDHLMNVRRRGETEREIKSRFWYVGPLTALAVCFISCERSIA